MQWHDPAPSPVALVPLLDCPEYRAELARQATERSMSNPIHAEIIPGTEPHWHIVVTAPQEERATADHLMERGFGVYLPEFEKTSISRGVKRTRKLPMFRGYVLVFVWGIDRQWRRMETVPGVVRLLCLGETPVIVPDRIIDLVQAAEAELQLHGGVVQRGCVVEKKRKRPRRKKPQIEGKDPDLPPHVTLGPTEEMVTITTKRYFVDAALLDGNQRKSLLHVALGLPLQTAP